MTTIEAPQAPLSSESQLATREAWQDEIAVRGQAHELPSSEFNIHPPVQVSGLYGEEAHFDDEDLRYGALWSLIYTHHGGEEKAAAVKQHVKSIEDKYVLAAPKVYADVKNPFLESTATVELVDPRKEVTASPLVRDYMNSRDISEYNPEFTESLLGFAKIFTQGVTRGIDLGYIPAAVAERLKDSLSKTRIRLADSAILNAVPGGLLAYYHNEYDEVGISHTTKDKLDDFVHELTHKTSGGTFERPKADSTEYYRRRAGFSTETKQGVLNRTGLNEATTHHVTLGILTGDFETLDPDLREYDDNIYYGYRKILATFVNRSSGLINVKTLINGYFEDTGPGGSTTARRALIRETNQTYGHGALTKLEKLFSLTSVVPDDKLDDFVLKRIHPPVFNEGGVLITKGFIDTKDLPTAFEVAGIQIPEAYANKQ